MSVRTARRYTACIAIVGIAFGQFALGAYTCPVPVERIAFAAHAMPSDAAAPCMEKDAVPVPMGGNANVCEVHCTDVMATPAPPDLPPVVLAAIPTATPAIDASAVALGAPESVAPVSGAPPVTLQFCRLLI